VGVLQAVSVSGHGALLVPVLRRPRRAGGNSGRVARLTDGLTSGLTAVPEIQVLHATVGTGDWRLQVNDFSEHVPPEDLTGVLGLWIASLAQECLRQAPGLRLAYEHGCLNHVHHGVRERRAAATGQEGVALRNVERCEREKATGEAQEPGIGLLLERLLLHRIAAEKLHGIAAEHLCWGDDPERVGLRMAGGSPGSSRNRERATIAG
jgi:hypothetical protein